MIFVTVGTHHLPFNRLLQSIDKFIKERQIKEKVVIQSGTTSVVVAGAVQEISYDFKEFVSLLKKARIVVSHAGPATIFQCITLARKIPIVVPRLKEFGEHVGNHQLYFAKDLAKKNNIHLCISEKDILNQIKVYQPQKIVWKQSLSIEKKLKCYIDSLKKNI